MRGGRQKGLVDHVCPADFSYLSANGKGSVNHYYPSVADVESACALAAFVSRCGGIVTQAGGNRVRFSESKRAGQWLRTSRRKARTAQKPHRRKRASSS